MPSPHRFIALYEGKTICEARIIAASDAPELVRYVTEALDHNTPAKNSGKDTQRIERGRRTSRRSGVRQDGDE